MKSKVYFTRKIDSDSLCAIYDALGVTLHGKVAVKISTGEPGGHHYLNPQLIKPLVDKVGGTIVECNTAYEGRRYNTKDHWQAIRDHGFMDIAPCDIMDEDGEMSIPVTNGVHLSENFVGAHFANYDSMLVLNHFKGHAMGGFGGALKNMSIGIASSHGKAHIHGVGEPSKIWTADHDSFLESMADSAGAVFKYFKGNIAFINVMKNMSVDCDCCAVAEDPCLADMGIMASLDPVAIDQACIDKVYACDDPGKAHFIERVESRNGVHTIEAAAELGYGSREYELIEI